MSSSQQKLIDAVERFDGQTVESLAVAFEKTQFDRIVVRQLLQIVERCGGHQPAGASWLLKRASDDNHIFPANDISRMIRLLRRNLDFGATLHLLQIVGNAKIPKSSTEQAFSEFERWSRSRKALLRAWALNALHTLAEQHSDYRPAVCRLLRAVYEKESASVKARLRHAAEASSFFEIPGS